MIALHATAESSSLWAAWSVDPITWLAVAAAAALYARGLRSLGPRPRLHASWRPWSFYGGLALVLLVLVSPLDHLAEELFFAHMTQHILLIMVGVPLVLLGAPLVPILRGIPRPVRRSLVIPAIKSPPVRGFLKLVTQPVAAWLLFVSVLLLWHVPPLFEAALESEWTHLLQHATFAGAAYVYWWNVIDPAPLKPNLAYLVRIPYTFLTVVPNFTLSAFLTFAPSAWYSPYELTAPARGFTAIEDQQLGGLIMWIPGSFIIGTAMLLSLYFALRTEERDQLALEAAEG